MSTNVAFEILYKEYYVRVFGLCRRILNSPTQAEDATQETFMRAYRSFNKYDSAQPFWQWISTIASNHCIDVIRRLNRAGDLFGDESEERAMIEVESESLAQIIESEDAAALSSAIGQLPDKYRIPLVLAYFHDSSYDAIADDLSISRNHVGVLLLRAKQKLRTLIDAEAAA